MVSGFAFLIAFLIPMCLGVVPPPPPGMGAWGGGVGKVETLGGPVAVAVAEAGTVAKAEKLAEGGKTVLVFFHADWDASGKVIWRTVIETPEFSDLLGRHDAAFLQVDMTQQHEERAAWLKDLGRAGVPTLAIYPAGKPKAPKVVQTMVNLQSLEAALKAASKAKE